MLIVAIMAKSRTTRPKLRNSILPKVGGKSARREPAEVLAPLVIRMAGYAESQLEQSITAAVRRNATKAIAVAATNAEYVAHYEEIIDEWMAGVHADRLLDDDEKLRQASVAQFGPQFGAQFGAIL